jgi:peptidoglycan/LPS O-acetylase OafA/YrhL
VFANLTLCFGLLPNANISVIGVGWFLGTVFVFYLVFPFFCYLLSNRKRAWFSFVVALIFNFLCETYFNAGRTNIVYSGVFFLAGGLVYLYRDLLEKMAGKYRWIILIGIAVTVAGYYAFGAYVPLMLLLFSMMLIYTLGIQVQGMLQNPVTKFISGISMEIYLCHMVIFRLIEKIGLTHLFASGVMSYIVTAAGTIIGAILFAFLSKKALAIAEKSKKYTQGRCEHIRNLS